MWSKVAIVMVCSMGQKGQFLKPEAHGQLIAIMGCPETTGDLRGGRQNLDNVLQFGWILKSFVGARAFEMCQFVGLYK